MPESLAPRNLSDLLDKIDVALLEWDKAKETYDLDTSPEALAEGRAAWKELTTK